MIVLRIAAFELRRLFAAPFAWLALAVVQFTTTLFFLLLLARFRDPSGPLPGGLTAIVVGGTLQIAAVVLLLVVPFLGLRLFAEEQRHGTIALLLSAPLSLTGLVAGKFLGLLGFLIAALAPLALLPLVLAAGTQLDTGQVLCGFLGLALLLSAAAAAATFVSTLTAQPALAALGSFALLFLLWIVHVAAWGSGERTAAVLRWLSLRLHFENLLSGWFSSADAGYFLLLAVCFLALAIWRLDRQRTHH